MNKKRKSIFRRIAACTLSAMLLVSAGCGRPEGVGGPNKKIVVIGKQEGLSFWDDVKKGAEAAGEELQLDIIYSNAQSDNDYATQIQDINNAILQNADAIVIAPNSKTELTASLQKAADKGIEVIYMNSKAEFNAVSTVYSSDYDGGSLAARNVIKILDGKGFNYDKLGKVGVVGHTASTAEERIEGFTATFVNKVFARSTFIPATAPAEGTEEGGEAPDAEMGGAPEAAMGGFGYEDPAVTAKKDDIKKCIIRGEDSGTREKAKEEAKKLLKEDGNGIDVMFATNTVTTLGVCDAIVELELAGKIVVVGFNSDEEELDYIRNRVLDGTVIQNPYVMGYVAVRYAKKTLDGMRVPVELDTGSTYIDASNMHEDYNQLLIYPTGKPTSNEGGNDNG